MNMLPPEWRDGDLRHACSLGFSVNPQLSDRNPPQLLGTQPGSTMVGSQPRFPAPLAAHGLNLPATHQHQSIPASLPSLQQFFPDNLEAITRELAAASLRTTQPGTALPGPIHFREGDTAEDMFAMYVFKVEPG
jgi:hypothetical protein